MRADATADVLADRLRDRRSKRVAFLSHCILNENTRYLGGACRNCCVEEIVQQCIERGIGMVQLPCPEAEVWGGVLRRQFRVELDDQPAKATGSRSAPRGG